MIQIMLGTKKGSLSEKNLQICIQVMREMWKKLSGKKYWVIDLRYGVK